LGEFSHYGKIKKLEFFFKCKFKTNAKTLETFAKLLKSQNERKRKKLITIMDAYQNKWLIMQLLCPLWQVQTCDIL